MRLDSKRGLHVLMTADAVGGVFTYALDLVGGLAAACIETTLVLSGPAPSPAQRSAAETSGATIVEIEAPLDWTARDEAEVRVAARRLADVCAAARPDIIHMNSPALAAHGTFGAPVLGVCHSCLATWWHAVKGGNPPDDVAWRMRTLAAGYAACDALVAPSRTFAEATAEAYEIPIPTVIHNGHRAALAADDAREPLVLTAGRLWDDGKDVATLDHAAVLIAAPCVALGPTRAPDGSGLIFPALRTMGALDPSEVAAWMARASIYASAARYEPFGLAVLEAASAGAALVLSDIPTFRELWEGAACFVPCGDAAAFASAINGLLASPTRLQAASRAAGTRSRRYGMASMVENYLSVYMRLVRRPISQARFVDRAPA